MSCIELIGLKKLYKDGTSAVDNFNLRIEDGELVVLVGPSGCGKSTVLRLIAGLEDLTDGDIRVNGRSIKAMDPKDREMAMVFQNYALYPHLTVEGNLAFPLQLKKMDPKRIKDRIGQVLDVLGLKEICHRKPRDLSGGQQQRVSVGRALSRKPAAFLLDEPLSNLDAILRAKMRVELAKLKQASGATMVYVTHDQIEAMTLADKLLVMNEGKIQQIGSPREIYSNPSNRFVAEFIGLPQINCLTCPIKQGRVDILGKSYQLTGMVMNGLDQVIIGIRPDQLLLKDGDHWQVQLIENYGDHQVVFLEDSSGQAVRVQVEAGQIVKMKQVFDLGIRDLRSVLLFDAQNEERLAGQLREV
ncbi:ABC transporter ATP-binding protein [Atopobacter sp. AH10]|uniref:ABC transporter ATP-binding protein n=1 Tax=Atopobacter sp. AH10 TaxID=2315861 RepID=UPI000EF19C43|nr:ABC transporter ATP-binding protein [Atopobacter sp. AH10]RLK63331.1 ABC transporter ATP-binding protein [Atopobacter sp. AH10]